MVRKLSLAIALALGVTPFAVNSLGLGDIKTRSGLNQQFQADIELLSVKNEDIGDIRVSLASDEVFATAGVSRPYFLSQLKFKPVLLPNGKGIIRVTSGGPVREPFLNFLIELNWPNGRLFREFTVLLDPPVTLQRRPSPVQAATTTSKVDTTRSAGSGSSGLSEYGPTRRNDTLWKIASEVRHSGTSMEQMMMAMFQANPHAFIRANINNLKIGEILRVPERQAVLAMTASEARIAFRDQVENWRLDRPAPASPQPGQESAAGDIKPAGKEPPEAGSAEAAVPEAELKIARMRTAEESGKSIADSVDQKGGSSSLNEDLLEAREMRESALEESKELKSRVQGLASQLEDLQRLLELKDEQLANLQIALGGKPDISVAPAAEATTATDTAVTPVLPGAVVSSAETAAAGEEAAAPNLESVDDAQAGVEIPQFDGMAQEEEESAAGAEDEKPTTVSEATEKAVMTADTGEAESSAEPKPAVVAVDEKMETTSLPVVEPEQVQKPEAGFLEKLTSHPLLKKITSDPTMMAIAGGVVAVLLALIWLLTGRRKKGEPEFQESILTDTTTEKAKAAVIGEAEISEPETRNTEETSFLSDFSPSDIDALPEETGEVDPLAEADVYIAYGRYGQAEELVRQGLERNPRNQELKLKLFEILCATKNVEAFTALAKGAIADGLPEADPGAWASVATMGAKLAPGNSLYAIRTEKKFSSGMESEGGMSEPGDIDLGDLAASLDIDDGSTQDQTLEVISNVPEEKQKAPPLEDDSPDDAGLKSSFSKGKGEDAADLDKLGDELASLDSSFDFDLDELESDGLDLEKIAQDAVTPTELDDVALDFTSLVQDSDAGAAEESGLSVEGIEGLDLDTEEVERLELPEESTDELAADTGPSDEINTKLDLARAYLDMGDEEGARSLLQEVVNEGSEQQKQAAQEMIGGFS